MITVYTKYGCPQCDMTKRVLDGEGIEYRAVNIEEIDPSTNQKTEEAEKAYSYIKDELGYSSMPVVVKDGEEPFSGFRPDRLLNFS